MKKKKYRKLRKDTNSNRFEEMMQSLGKREIIIISSVIFAVTLAIILLMAVRKGYMDNGFSNVVSEETTVDGSAPNAALDGEDMPVVETATEGMKSESTPDTTVLAKKEGAKDGYLNRCVFLGDSRTVAMVNYGFFNDDAALAQIGISHPSFSSNKFINNAGKEYTLKSYLESHQAPVIYILLGVNGINDPSETHYQNTFLTLIDNVAKMAPNSNLVLVAIGPVDDNGIYKKTVQNAWIDKYNAFLLETAKEKHIFYLDIAEILKGSNGQVKSEYNGGDGLHYSGKGCEAIFRYIVEHPVPGISDEGEYVVKYIKPDPNRIKATITDDSGIDEGNIQDLMNMMMGTSENQNTSDAGAQSSEETEEELRLKEEEEAKKKAEEEEARKRAEEEEAIKKAKEEEEKKKAEEEEAIKKAKEEEERKKAEEEEERRKAEEEEKKKAEEEEKNKDNASEEGSDEESDKDKEEDASSASSSEEIEEDLSNQSEEENVNNP
ncbi:GDSL-type esterase/lipase family protein [Butyrivibrio sp. FCS014]|uniref:GDSL-type esterase/lipase family protein n=1 Tax=Butyrivibrio sp. FCS014 TaxID=1408304 RepID=UPI00046523C2|nr:SGNH/GDSL hydrolase family protein [Butyrivibrio sp. FCS014]